MRRGWGAAGHLLDLVGEGGDEGRVGGPAVQDGPADGGQAGGGDAAPELVEGGAGGGAGPLRELREGHCAAPPPAGRGGARGHTGGSPAIRVRGEAQGGAVGGYNATRTSSAGAARAARARSEFGR